MKGGREEASKDRWKEIKKTHIYGKKIDEEKAKREKMGWGKETGKR